MGQDIIATIKRGNANTVILQNEPFRLDNISPITVSELGGRSPYDSYMLLSQRGMPDVQRLDHVIDQATGTAYLVFGAVEKFDQSYLRAMVERILTS